MEHSAVFSNLDTEQRKLSSLYQENCKNASPRDAMIVTFTSQSHIHKEKSREQERKVKGFCIFQTKTTDQLLFKICSVTAHLEGPLDSTIIIHNHGMNIHSMQKISQNT